MKQIRNQWLMWSPAVKHSRTPFGRVHNVLHIVSKSSYSLGTATFFDFATDGQTMKHSVDEGINWNNVDFSLWPKLSNGLMQEIEDQISMQLPSSLKLSDLLTNDVMDDLTLPPPHMQTKNKGWMSANAMSLKLHLLSSSERHHSLMLNGKLQTDPLDVYLRRDQNIRGLIAALVATTTGLCLRPFQFKSIKIGTDTVHKRNVWLLDGRFLLGKPAAKQQSLAFAETLFWLPRNATRPLSVFFYFLQPFIDQVLCENNRQYSIDLWPLWPAEPKPKSGALSLWNGAHINKAVRRSTKNILDIPLSCNAIRQLAEGLLHEKLPSLFEPFHTSRDRIPSGTYHIDHVLKIYAAKHRLERLVDPTNIEKDKIAAVLLTSDIWQGLIHVEPKSDVWLPLAKETFMFYSGIYNDMAYAKAQHLKKVTELSGPVSLNTLSQALKLLEKPNFFNANVCHIGFNI